MSQVAKRALLCCNSKARNGNFSLDEVRQILREGGIEPVDPPQEGDACGAIRALAGQVDLVILGGGDGTMNAAAEALVETGLPACHPAARHRQRPRPVPRPAARSPGRRALHHEGAAATSRSRLGQRPLLFQRGEHRLFGELAGELTSEAKKRFGVFGYAVAAVRVLRRVRPSASPSSMTGRSRRSRPSRSPSGTAAITGAA